MNPNAIKAVIVDDEVGSRNNLRLLLEEYCQEVEVCGMGHDVLSGLELVKKHRPRILFLDIEMPQHSGFKLVEMLDPQERPGIVFVTAYEQYAIRAFKVSAVDYLLKPIVPGELQTAVEKIMRQDQAQREAVMAALQENLKTTALAKIAIPHQEGFSFLDPQDIVVLEASRSYTQVHVLDGRRLLVARSLREFDDLLTDDEGRTPFFRPHRSYIIHLGHVREWVRKDGGFLLMANDLKVTIARNRQDEFLRRYRSFE